MLKLFCDCCGIEIACARYANDFPNDIISTVSFYRNNVKDGHKQKEYIVCDVCAEGIENHHFINKEVGD